MGARFRPSRENSLTNQPKVLVAHPGTQHAFHLARELNRHGLLFRLWTGFAVAENSLTHTLIELLPVVLRSRLNNRIVKGVPAYKIKTTLWIEWFFRLISDRGKGSEEALHHRNKMFQEVISESDIKNCDLVIGFDTSSWILIQRCRKFNKKFFLDVSIGHPLTKEKIYERLQQRYDLWGRDLVQKKKALIDSECSEIADAHCIVVPSDFVRKTYLENGVSQEKIRVNPFGINVFEYKPTQKKKSPKDRVRFLFFGSLTARKGLPLLLEVWRDLDLQTAELILAGYGAIPSKVILPKNVICKGQIKSTQKQALFDSADVFVFPSNFEGLALVQIEAAACGLPIIGSYNSGSAEIIENEKNGFLIEPEDRNALAKAIWYFINQPSCIEGMGSYSRLMAEKFTRENYGDRWSLIINQLI